MRRRALSEEERALWRQATRDVNARRTIAEPVAPPASAHRPRPAGAKVAAPPSLAPIRSKPPSSRDTPAKHFVFGGGDPALDRAAASRRINIERTLDLHGLTQAMAQRFLERFIEDAARDGVRLVLVITGKGRPQATASVGRQGVLRSRFLDWIEAPALKSSIARVAPAKPKDGGGGAFYVFLKARRRAAPIR